MNLIQKVKKVIRNPLLIPLKLIPKYLIPDSIFLKLQYKLKTGRKLNLKNPVLYNEKIQWLKLHDRKPEYSKLADKYEVREYVAKTIGEEYLIPLYGVWDSFNEIPFDSLPDEFVLKCTHDSGGVFICHDKQTLDIPKTRKFFQKRLSANWYWHSREWAYKTVKPRIIAEKLMVDESGYELKDYKILCFNGEPKIICVIFDRSSEPKINMYSLNWNYQNLKYEYPSAPHIMIKKPDNLELMLELAKKLSAGKIYIRVDFYAIGSKLFFGELTLYPTSGYVRFDPPEWNKTFGDWMILSNRS